VLWDCLSIEAQNFLILIIYMRYNMSKFPAVFNLANLNGNNGFA
jgi:hypothetical protein